MGDRGALEVSAFLIETGKFERFYKEMQIADLQKELGKWIKKIMVESFEVKMKDLVIKMIHVSIMVYALRVIIEYKW